MSREIKIGKEKIILTEEVEKIYEAKSNPTETQPEPTYQRNSGVKEHS